MEFPTEAFKILNGSDMKGILNLFRIMGDYASSFEY